VILACGDEGSIALLGATGAPKHARIADTALHAAAPLGDGTAAVVGAGGFAFRVWPTSQAQLESSQTTRDLFSLAQSPDGIVWAAGAERRVLRRDPGCWTRVSGPGESAAVRGLYAGDSRVVAVCEDGMVIEGTRT
jgi:hypothetical protein